MKRKILYYDNGIPTPDGSSGGSFYSLFELLKLIDQSKFEVLVVFKFYHNIVEDYNKFGFKTHVIFHSYCKNIVDVNNPSKKLNSIKNYKIFNRIKRELFFIINFFSSESKSLIKIIRNYKPDYIHANNRITANSNIVLIAYLMKIKCLIHQRQYDYNIPFILKLIKSYPKFISISTSISNNLIENGISKNKIQLVHNCVNLDYINHNLKSECKSLDFHSSKAIWFGRIINWKGLLELLDVFHELKHNFKIDFKLDVYGDFNEDRNYFSLIQNKIKVLDLCNLISFFGYKKNKNISFKKYSIFFHSSTRKEPFGRTIIESMSNSVVVFTTGKGGVSDIVNDNVNGFIFDLNKPKLTALKLVNLSQHNVLFENIQIKAFENITNFFSSSSIKNKVERLYDF